MKLLKHITRKRAFIAVTLGYFLIALTFLVLTAVQTQDFVGKKHPGFLTFDNGLVFGLVDSEWTGAQAGLRMYDFVESYDGQKFTSTKNLIQYLNNAETNKGVVYQLKRQDKPLTLTIKPLTVTQDFASIYFYIFLFCGFFTILTGIGIFVIRPLAKGAFQFFVICNTIGIFEILLADLLSYQTYLLYFQLSIALFAVTNIHIIYYLLKIRKDLKKSLNRLPVKVAIGLLYAAVMVFAAIVYYYSHAVFSDYRVLLFTSNFLFFLAGILIYVTATYLYFSAKSSTLKRRLLLYTGLNLSCLIAFVIYVAHNVCAVLIPIEVMLVQVCFPFVTIYVLFRYNFLDLRFTPKRKYFYISFAVLIPVLFLVDFLFLIPVLNKYSVSIHLINSLVFASVALKLLLLVYAAYARIVDRLFFPSTFKFRDVVTKASDTILNHHSQPEIIEALTSLLANHLEIQKVYFYYQNTGLNQYQKQPALVGSDIEDGTYNQLPHSFSDEEIPLSDVDYVINEFSSNTKAMPPALKLLIKHNLNLLLPLKFQKQIQGFVLLGPKPNYVPYTTEDLTNIQTLLATTTVALLNAKHHQSLLALHKQLERENKRLKQEIRNKITGTQIIGEEKGLKTVMKKIEMIQGSSISVLLQGETGTGKEVVAQAIHDRSQRVDKPFIKVNCSAIPENLFESELFGHEKGSFTGATEQKIGLFEAAHKGTLFLDEVGEVPLHIQPKLLRVLQEKEIQRVGSTERISVDVRIIAATNRDLEHAVKKNTFRQDLYYRLNVLPVFIPPLRERQADIEDLLDCFIRKYSVEMKKHLEPPKAEEIKKLKNYPWPGNVRELQNVVERSVALTHEGERLSFFNIQQDLFTDTSLEKIFEQGDFYNQMDELKKQVIQRAIQRAGGNKSQAARELGLHQVSLYKMVKQLSIE